MINYLLLILFSLTISFSQIRAEDDNEVYKHLNLFGEAFEITLVRDHLHLSKWYDQTSETAML